jgi:endonuclease/exonuclease/phosphatase family metal-dependent hydrolase
MICLVWSLTARAEEQGADDPPALRVMSFNIRYNNPRDGENAWPHRRDWVAEIIRGRKTDVAGLQEAQLNQIEDLQKRLPGYGWFGVGRDDGKNQGEFVPIFYRKDRFEVLEKDSFWLSETPDQPGSVGWDAAITRVVTWGKLKDKQTGRELYAFNTHFDHRGPKARKQSARLLIDRMKQIAGDAPVVLTGDFNTGVNSKPYQTLTGKSQAGEQAKFALREAREATTTKPQGPNSTWNGFSQVKPGRRIDFIFTHGPLRVLSYRVLDEQRDGRFPSDHLPVLAELALVSDK